MRLYLSSFGFGNCPDQLISLLPWKKRVAVVLNAKDASPADNRARSLAEQMAAMDELGLTAFELDLRDYFGKQERLRETLGDVDLVWVRGGNTFVLRRAFKQSGLDDILNDLLRKDDLAYGGFSAGVSVLTPTLVGIEIVDDPRSVPEGYAAEPVWEGLGILPYVVAPHYRSDHPESAAVEKLVQRYIDDKVLFKVLRDGEAIVIDGQRHDVVGSISSQTT